MEILLHILQGLATLLALGLLDSFVIRLWPFGARSQKVVLGFIFGGAAVLGMLVPAERLAGVILEPRWAIVAMASVFGGPVVGLIAAAMAVICRLLQGGEGALLGSVAIAISMVAGMLFNWFHKRGWAKLGVAEYVLFGSLLHAALLFFSLIFAPEMGLPQLLRLGVAYIGIYTLGTVILGVILQDGRKRYETERALQASEARYRAAYDGVPIGIVETDEKGVIRSFNRAAEEIYRCPNDKALGQEMRMFLPDDTMKDWEGDFGDFVAQRVEPVVGQYIEVTGKRGDGDLFPIRVGTGEMVVGGERRYISLVSDLTEMKSLEVQLLRAQRMEAVGQLTGGIAHDFNNVLGIILGNLELLEETLEDETALSRVDAALRGARRGAEITRKLLDFSRGQSSGAQSIVINEALESLSGLIRQSLTASIQLDLRFANNLWMTLVDPGELQDAILNLAINARDAMPHGGRITLRTENQVVGDAQQGLHAPIAEGEYVVITLSDTGHGMDERVRNAAFEPFFSTKADGEGSGLGLSMVYGFVTRAGGYIDLQSQPDQGTTFRIYLPRVAAPAEPVSQQQAVSSSLEGGTETILVVDDEVSLAELACTNLEALGYRVLKAHEGETALKILAKHPEIDLLFTDVILPGEMDGYKLAAAALARDPSLKVLVTSGFTRRREEAAYARANVALVGDLLHKPYSRAQLAAAVRRRLDAVREPKLAS